MKPLRYLSVCSGIEAASVAWHPLGFEPIAFAEIERFPSAVLAHHYPNVPNWGDLEQFRDWPDAAPDVLVGGTPCQSFSVAGLRKGLDDPRGGLLYAYLATARRFRPRWVVWENVPGVLSSDDGRAFGTLLGGLAELGYGFTYRVLDAQYFNLAQRRARVFVVGHLGDWRRAAAVLSERASLSGHPPPRRETWESVAGTIGQSSNNGRSYGSWPISDSLIAGTIGTHTGIEAQQAWTGRLVPSTGELSHCLNAGGMGRIGYETETLITHALRADGFDASEDGTGRGTPLVTVVNGNSTPETMDDCAFPLRADNGSGNIQAVAFAENQRGEVITSDTMGALKVGGGKPGQGYPAVAFAHQAGGDASTSLAMAEEMTPTLNRSQTMAVQHGMSVRRLTPRECERLQGFPDGYTLIPYRGKPAADGPRYKALGNSMAVPVMRWIGQRIQAVEGLT